MPATWPAGLPYNALADTWQLAEPFREPLSTDVEDGPAITRRSTTKNIAVVPLSIRFTAAQFGVFKTFVRDTLVDGTQPFTMKLWTGSASGTRTCRFIERYTAQPQGRLGIMVVSLKLDVEDL